MNDLSFDIRKKVLERDDFTCRKCGFKDTKGKDLEIHHVNPKIFQGNDGIGNLVTLCSICHRYAPDNEKELLAYIFDKIDGKILDTFRKSNYSISRKTKEGMQRKAKEGGFITKAPKGYKIVNKKLLIDEQEAEKVREIFNRFLNEDISLTQLAKDYGLTTSGLKKLLQNTTYIGKTKFADEESKGEHEAIIEEELFRKVGERL